MMTVPMIIFILPTLFIVLMGPAALGILDTFNKGGNGPKQVTVVTHKDDEGTDAHPPEITEKKADDAPLIKAPPKDMPPATLTPDSPIATVGQPVAIDVDAHELTDFDNLRVVLVPMGTPDPVSDETAFFAAAKAVAPTQMRIVIIPPESGPSELRLYAAPLSGAGGYRIAARAPLFITPTK
jgi:hypothetical protein